MATYKNVSKIIVSNISHREYLERRNEIISTAANESIFWSDGHGVIQKDILREAIKKFDDLVLDVIGDIEEDEEIASRMIVCAAKKTIRNTITG